MLKNIKNVLIHNNKLFYLVFLLQIAIVAVVYIYTRSSMLWLLIPTSFILVVYVFFDLNLKSKRIILILLFLLFLTQHIPWLSLHGPFGFSISSDAINDLHVALSLSEKDHFEIGDVGNVYRSSRYSFNLSIHLLTVIVNRITNISIELLATKIIPIILCLATVLGLYLLYNIFILNALDTSIVFMSMLIYATNYFYVFKHSQFIREVYAFPLALICLYILFKKALYKKNQIWYSLIFILLILSVIIAHQFTSLVMVALVIYFLICVMVADRKLDSKIVNISILVFCMTLTYSIYVATTYFSQQITATWNSFAQFLIALTTKDLTTTESFGLMQRNNVWVQLVSYGYYIVIYPFAVLGFLSAKKYNISSTARWFLSLMLIVLPMAALLRLSSQEMWMYSLSVRSNTWSLIGISFFAAIGAIEIARMLKINKKFIVYVLIAFLSVSSLSQQDNAIRDGDRELFINQQRYIAANWVKSYSDEEKQILIAPSKEFPISYEIMGDFAPYAFRKEYFLDWSPIKRFNGYVPITKNMDYQLGVKHMLIYENGDLELGFIDNSSKIN